MALRSEVTAKRDRRDACSAFLKLETPIQTFRSHLPKSETHFRLSGRPLLKAETHFRTTGVRAQAPRWLVSLPVQGLGALSWCSLRPLDSLQTIERGLMERGHIELTKMMNYQEEVSDRESSVACLR